MIKPTIHCDVCDRPKGEANKWLLVFTQVDNKFVIFNKWNDDIAQCTDIKHICGEECLHKLLEPFLAARSQG